jgi:hypothetical protein
MTTMVMSSTVTPEIDGLCGKDIDLAIPTRWMDGTRNHDDPRVHCLRSYETCTNAYVVVRDVFGRFGLELDVSAVRVVLHIDSSNAAIRRECPKDFLGPAVFRYTEDLHLPFLLVGPLWRSNSHAWPLRWALATRAVVLTVIAGLR